ncbi:alkanal monooxygenase [Acrocarpospora phusangensis]|uniref:Alkanal monooxygenase n=1 Tax=Acrocarpospora phusangensis TaxID=1070424 RepID=A0A919UJH7_9ACTN|nr:LLM class flavin-dependent oxidoreductase [Acrocarpospora phusangensis]GIH23851.1 alkanal monooxygenase [Acrocarpospora phusangensis]
MRIGVFLIAAGGPHREPGQVLRDTLEAVAVAEESGFDDAWIAEHHFMSYGVCPSAVTLAAMALGRTERIGLGTAVSVLSTAHPVALAEQAAMLHHLSGGRFTLGVGRGGPWVDLEVFGSGLDRWERGFPESLDLLCRALSQATVSADGEFFQFREVDMVPPATLRPVVARASERTTRIAAERGLALLLGMELDDPAKAAILAEYGRLAPAARPPHLAAVLAFVGDSTAAARKELLTRLPRWLEPGLAGYVRVDGLPRQARDLTEYMDFLARVHPVGDADHCVRTITSTREATGLGHLILMVEGGADHGRTLENIRRLGAEVLPRLRAQP